MPLFKSRRAQPKKSIDSRRGGPRLGARRLQFESLERRELFAVAASPFTFINNAVGNATTGALAYPDNQVNIAIYGSDYAASPSYYYFDANGTPHLTSTAPGGVVPSFSLTALTQTGTHAYTINLPQSLPTFTANGIQSARVYVSMNSTLSLTVNGDGSVNGPTPNNTFYDFFEFSLNAPNNPVGNLNIDTTNVDQFGLPIKINLISTDTNNVPAGVGMSATRASVISQFQQFTSALNDPYAVCLWPVSDPVYGQYRIQNPSDVLNEMDPVINLVQVQTTLTADVNTTQTTIKVYAAGAFPSPSTNFTIKVDQELMTVTGATQNTDKTTTWTVIRGVGGSSAAAHTHGAAVTVPAPAISNSQTTLTVASAAAYPTTFPFYVLVDQEIMQVSGVKSNNLDGTTTWNVVRAQQGSTAATHNAGAQVIYDPATASPLNSYFNAAIDALFNEYLIPSNTLSIVSQASGSTQTYQGKTAVDGTGRYILKFADPTNSNVFYNVYYPFFNDNRYLWGSYTPLFPAGNAPTSELQANVASLSPSMMVFSCNGVFADNTFRTSDYTPTQLKVLADIENQIVSALNRGVALSPASGGSGSWSDPSIYYNNNPDSQVWNRYAEFLHKSTVSIGGKNYGFAFDDQQGQASDIGVGSFLGATITLGPWVTPPAQSLPAAPSSTMATPEGGSELFLSWQSASPSVTEIVIYRYNGTQYVPIAFLPGTALTYQDTNLQPLTTYYYAIRAFNTVGFADGWVNGTTGSASAVMPPTNLSAVPIGGNELDLYWTEISTNVASFIIYRYNGSSYVPITTLPGTARTYHDIGLQPSTYYQYCVRAVGTNGTHADGWVNGTTGTSSLVVSPRILVNGLTSNQIGLTWQQSPLNLSQFLIYRFNGSQYTQIAALAASARNYQDTSLRPGTFYSYAIRAVATDGTYADGWISASTLA